MKQLRLRKTTKKRKRLKKANIRSVFGNDEREALAYLSKHQTISVFNPPKSPSLETIQALVLKGCVERLPKTRRYKTYDAGITVFRMTPIGELASIGFAPKRSLVES